MMKEKPFFKRVLLKISGDAFCKAAGLGIDQFEARRIIDDFLGIHFQVAEWRDKTIEDTKESGYAKE